MNTADVSDLSESDDDSPLCPLCYGPMDKTDLALFPCPCNFQICIWCLNTLVADSRPCPNCRRPYNKANYRIMKIDKEMEEERSKAEEKTREESRRSIVTEDSRDLQTIRVIQKNLVYVIGIPIEAADETNLRRQDMFGQYGHLNKIVVNSKNPVGDKSNTCGVYLTYETEEQALECIRAVDGYSYCRRQLKASYGTTKYCFAFVRGQKCNNPDCLYLHQLAPKEDCFTKEEMSQHQQEFYQLTHPGNGSSWDERQQRYVYKRITDEYNTSLPPPSRNSPKLVVLPRKSPIKSSGSPSLQSSGDDSQSIHTRISEIGSPKQDEGDELVFSCSSPIVLIGFSESNRILSEPDIATSLEESVLKAIPYSFESLGFGIKGDTFGLQMSDSTPEKIDVERLLQCGSILESSSTNVLGKSFSFRHGNG
ncbi:hypothetical protein WA171_004362 [Blastocystis sp. BT1]